MTRGVLFVVLAATFVYSVAPYGTRFSCQENGVFYLVNISTSMSYSMAQEACNDENVKLATEEQLQKAQNGTDFNVCWIGWLEGGKNTKEQVNNTENCAHDSTVNSSALLFGAFCYDASAVNISIRCRPDDMPILGVHPYKAVLIGVVTACIVTISFLLLAIIVFSCLQYRKQKDEVDGAWQSNTLISPYLSMVRHWDSSDPLPTEAPSN
uniref:uncharacterized protein n=1 Tax=Myxine glutinosa TaxID=7769 RepID=UPI00358DE4AD